LGREVIGHFVDIGGIVDYHCLSFFSIVNVASELLTRLSHRFPMLSHCIVFSDTTEGQTLQLLIYTITEDHQQYTRLS